jgi:NADPH:quinone reductase
VLAARIHAFGSPPALEDLPEPRLGAGDSLVEILAANVEHLDLDVASGAFPLLPAPPFVPGVSGTGRILESAAFERGALVHIDGADVGLGRDGVWAQRAAIPAEALALLPAVVDPVRFAAFCGSYVAAHLAIADVGRLASGERVLVTGAGGNVGALAVQLALARGAGAVVGAVGADRRRRRVPAGARAVVGVGEARAALAGHADLLVDTVGGEGLQGFVDLVRPGGRACLVGYTAGTIVPLDLPRLLVSDVRLLPVNSIGWRQRSAADPVAALREGALRAPFETHALRDVAVAIERLRARVADGRVVLVP